MRETFPLSRHTTMFAHERYDQFLAYSGTSFSRTFHLAQNCMGSLFLFDLFSIELGIWGHNSYSLLNLLHSMVYWVC
jgi:hypothetical protein